MFLTEILSRSTQLQSSDVYKCGADFAAASEEFQPRGGPTSSPVLFSIVAPADTDKTIFIKITLPSLF